MARVLPAFAQVLKEHGQDRWFRTAVLSCETGSGLGLLELLIRQDFFSSEYTPVASTFLTDLSFVIGSRSRDREVARFLSILLDAELEQSDVFQLAALRGLVEGLKKSDHPIKPDQDLTAILERMRDESVPEIADAVREIVQLW